MTDHFVRTTGPSDRLTALFEVLLCSSVPTQLAIGVLLRVAGVQPVDGDGNYSLTFVLVLSLLDTVVLIALMVALMRAHGERASALWLGGRSVGREVLYGLVTVPAVLIGVGLLLNTLRLFAPWLHNVPTNPLEQLAATPGQAALLALVAIVAGGVREELQRAFLLHRFEQHLGGAALGVVVLSVAFGLGHYVQGWDAVITTGTLGAVWAVMFLKRRSSVAPVVSHAGFNSLEIVRVAISS
ncbi:MAG: CPBP family intramembrane glutamic endopeptidase [Vicinamibacterales bacterium]